MKQGENEQQAYDNNMAFCNSIMCKSPVTLHEMKRCTFFTQDG